MKKPKYKNLTELAAAFASGELPAAVDGDGGYYIMLDKGGTEQSLNFYDSSLSDEENEARQEGCDALWSNDDDDNSIGRLFEALGIPWEWC